MSRKQSKSKKSRQPHQKKMVEKRAKSIRGVPEIYDELKKVISISITPTGMAGLDELSKAMGISRSELIERIGRRLLEIKSYTKEA